MKNWLKNNYLGIFAIITFLIGLYYAHTDKRASFLYGTAAAIFTFTYVLIKTKGK